MHRDANRRTSYCTATASEVSEAGRGRDELQRPQQQTQTLQHVEAIAIKVPHNDPFRSHRRQHNRDLRHPKMSRPRPPDQRPSGSSSRSVACMWRQMHRDELKRACDRDIEF